jgi:AraC family transcriptional regulator
MMHEEIEKAILRAVDTMHDRLGEQLTVDDLAQAAIFSKFHFSRVFQRVTGLSPGRFLSAVRLQEAKRLLAETSLPVTEVSIQVGYSSVGTFSTRFKSSVGVSPTTYRRLGRVTPKTLPDTGREEHGGSAAAVRGNIWSPVTDRPVFAGLFPDRILQGEPVRSIVLAGPGSYVIKDVPLGAWHLLAHSADVADAKAVTGHREADPCFARIGPIVVRPDTGTQFADLRLRPIRRLDPPVLLALEDLRNLATTAA